MYTKQVRVAAPTQEALDWRSLGTTEHHWRRNQARGCLPTLRPGLFRLYLFVAFGQEHTQNISVQWLNYSSTNMVTSFFLEIGPVRETNWSRRLNITWAGPSFQSDQQWFTTLYSQFWTPKSSQLWRSFRVYLAAKFDLTWTYLVAKLSLNWLEVIYSLYFPHWVWTGICSTVKDSDVFR